MSVVGIDLGTTFSAIAALDDRGRPATVPNRDGELLTPSAVLIADGEAEYTWIYVGESADISRRPLAQDRKACIDANEANCLCLYLADDPQARSRIVSDLARAYAPPCNRP